ncbi:multicopper oxidase family protein [Methylocystis hirsuta]|uniref:multicopper oxidase family protein n=1 Tax=Methylocystis hirsuta TaxID=369798 RepID=UPI001FDEEC32|nr:multicopper oxidase domain-containing protein [Methylocystis hirsuta]
MEAPFEGPADVTLRIGPVLVDVADDHTISTIGYNGASPGPLIRLKEGKTVTVELINETDAPEFVHWHGQLVAAAVDGAAEENSLVVPARGKLRYRLTPQPAGLRFVHSHVVAGADLHRGGYTGQHAPVYIEPANDPGRYDQEVFLTTHEWEPFFTGQEMEEGEEHEEQKEEKEKTEAGEEKPNGWEVGYRLFSINGRALGHGEPIRVRQGARVLFRILNASATENIKLALPGHRFLVVALDGNPVPTPKLVDVLRLGAAERIDAIVEMNHPGAWVLGTPRDDDRKNGLGVIVEYAGSRGDPQWVAPPRKSKWDYTIFGGGRPAPKPDQVIPMVFGKINGGKGGFNRWTINGKTYEDQGEPMKLQKGLRYRLAFDNRTDDAHPLHLHRNVFELTSVDGRPTAGVMKDVVVIRGFGRVDVDFTADQPGLSLFHCHHQLHMDYGFMQLFDVV